MHLRPANHRDLPAIHALLRAGHLPDVDVVEHLTSFLVGEQGRTLALSGGLELLGRFALLRSVAVAARYRGRGWGRRIVARLILQARVLGVAELYLLTNTAEDLFIEAGFSRTGRETAPQSLRVTRQFTSLCPASATLMHLDLTARIAGRIARADA
jgi:amino-acid N-acetyltransferase